MVAPLGHRSSSTEEVPAAIECMQCMQCTVLVDCRMRAGSEVGWANTNKVGGAHRPIMLATLTRRQLKLLT